MNKQAHENYWRKEQEVRWLKRKMVLCRNEHGTESTQYKEAQKKFIEAIKERNNALSLWKRFLNRF